MKKNENISILRGTILFFIILTGITLTLYGISYYQEIENHKKEVYNEMELNIYKKTKKIFKALEFPNHHRIILPKHIEVEGDSIVSYFPSPYNKDKIIKVYMPKTYFYADRKSRVADLTLTFFFVFIANITFSILLSGYILNPLRESVKITDEFIKDILHDINTPLSIIKINLMLLEQEGGENKKINRIKNGLEKIIFLQQNLKDYQLERQVIKTQINLKKLIEEKQTYFQGLYPEIEIVIRIKESITLETSLDIFTRVLDNIISNACKYNKTDGKVLITATNKYLMVKDTGIGIKDTQKVFNRLYKENDRGMGIGLNIVKKMIHELGMSITIESKENEGTIIKIYF